MTSNPYASPESLEISPPGKRPWRKRVLSVLAIGTILLVLAALFLPATRRAPQASRRTQCKNNLKQIALALFNYQDVYGVLPPACIVDAEGRPLHSWRTLILPYLDEQELYKSIDLSEAWNDPANVKAFSTEPSIYRCPSADLPPGNTTYMAVVGTGCCLSPAAPRHFSEITDDRTNTLMVFEVGSGNAVPWMSPQDADEPMVMSLLKTSDNSHTGGTQVAMADGKIVFLSKNMDSNTLRALTTIAGNEVIGEY
ncbi:MAG TPA: DUF1559 domain-containing protein [Planctomycetaceae bacterium]|nr:DUF1559 domain-containing protein [Planctomycetaceae bacterium]